MPDNNCQNQGQRQPQDQQGDRGNDAVDTGIDIENDGDMGTGNDVVGYDGTVRSPDGSSTGEDLDGDAELTPNQQAEDDPEANREEQSAT